jgi:hypothetical protein
VCTVIITITITKGCRGCYCCRWIIWRIGFFFNQAYASSASFASLFNGSALANSASFANAYSLLGDVLLFGFVVFSTSGDSGACSGRLNCFLFDFGSFLSVGLSLVLSLSGPPADFQLINKSIHSSIMFGVSFLSSRSESLSSL